MKNLGNLAALTCLTLLLSGCPWVDSSKDSFLVTDNPNCVDADMVRITTQPKDVTVFEGQIAEFQVTANGRLPIKYQWIRKRDGSPVLIDGPDSPTRRFNAVLIAPPMVVDYTVTQSGDQYWVQVSNECALFEESAVAVLTVLPALEITRQPQSITVVRGQPVTFTVEAGGIPPLSYLWRRGDAAGNFMNIPTATGPSLTLLTTDTADNDARFSVLVTNAAGASELSVSAVLTVQEPLSVLSASVSPPLPAGVPAYPIGVNRFIVAELGLPDARLRVSCLRSSNLLCEETAFDTSPPDFSSLLAEVHLPLTMLASTYRFGLRATLNGAVSEERILNLELRPGTGVLRCEQATDGGPLDSQRRWFGLQLQTAGGVPIANADYHVYRRDTTGRGWPDYRTVTGADRAILPGSVSELPDGVNFQAIAVERGGATPPAWAGREWLYDEPPGPTLGCRFCSNLVGGDCRIIPLGR